MKVKETKIKGVFIIEPEPREDDRGYFARVFAREVLKQNGIVYDIVHINRSVSRLKGTVRGIHYQTKPKEEGKIVQCLRGGIFDVAVDVRPKSKTFGQWVGLELSEKNKTMLLIPKGCAHAFQTLKPNSMVEYFVSEYYSPKHEKGFRYDEPLFKIKWPIKTIEASDKDRSWPHISK